MLTVKLVDRNEPKRSQEENKPTNKMGGMRKGEEVLSSIIIKNLFCLVHKQPIFLDTHRSGYRELSSVP